MTLSFIPSTKKERDAAPSLEVEMIREINAVMLILYRERGDDEIFFKWDGAIYISAMSMVEKINGALLSYRTIILSVEQYLNWDVKIKAASGYPGRVIRPVSQWYERNFHQTREIPSFSDYRNIFNGFRGGIGPGVLVLPEIHPFAKYCSKTSGTSVGNGFSKGLIKKWKSELRRGVIDQSTYSIRVASLTPPVEDVVALEESAVLQ
jgi:hypothetical protein